MCNFFGDVCACIYVFEFVCVCVCERERGREGERDGGRDTMCVNLFVNSVLLTTVCVRATTEAFQNQKSDIMDTISVINTSCYVCTHPSHARMYMCLNFN